MIQGRELSFRGTTLICLYFATQASTSTEYV